jgi:hypothetical protein
MERAPDECFALLHAAGWSVGEVRILTAAGPAWWVSGTNGANAIEARASTQAEAWQRARSRAGWERLLRCASRRRCVGPTQVAEMEISTAVDPTDAG